MNEDARGMIEVLLDRANQVKELITELRGKGVDLGSLHIELIGGEMTILIFDMTVEELCEIMKINDPVIVEKEVKDALFRSVTINGLTFQEIITSHVKGE